MKPFRSATRLLFPIGFTVVANFLFVPLASSADVNGSGRRPNILILLADDMGFADAGFQGCRDIPTPHLDALARGGVRCTNGYVSGPYCSPTRAGLLTGRYQQRFGHEFNLGGDARSVETLGMPVTEMTIADRLRAAGYATGLIGKWHLGEAPRFRPTARGFDEFFGFLPGANAYFPGDRAPIYRNNDAVNETEYLTDAFSREAVSFVERHREQPFFLLLSFNAVHTPLEADRARLEQFSSIADQQRRKYAAMTSAMDEGIGRVLQALKAANLEEETLIFFFSDNGGPTMSGVTVNGAINSPLRGSKRTTLEGGIRVPFVVQWKGELAAGTTYDLPVIQLDVVSTALAVAGAEVSPADRLDGINLLPYLKGKAQGMPHEALYWRLGEQMALRQGDWKIVRYDRAAEGGPAGKVSHLKLYNLADDIGETRDLATEHPEKVQKLETVWQAWNAQLARPLW